MKKICIILICSILIILSGCSTNNEEYKCVLNNNSVITYEIPSDFKEINFADTYFDYYKSYQNGKKYNIVVYIENIDSINSKYDKILYSTSNDLLNSRIEDENFDVITELDNFNYVHKIGVNNKAKNHYGLDTAVYMVYNDNLIVIELRNPNPNKEFDSNDNIYSIFSDIIYSIKIKE